MVVYKVVAYERWSLYEGLNCSAHDEPMTGQENQKRFVLHLHIFHLYLIIN